MTPKRYACIEAGGTKFVAAVATAPDNILDSIRIETTSPDSTLTAVFDWLRAHGPLDAAGIASFGPLDLDPESPTWGHFTNTPKPGWSGASLAPRMSDALGVPVAIDTDVAGAAMAEARWGAARGQKLAVYVTVGTGIGGAAVLDCRPVMGVSHAEMGHYRPQRHPDDLAFDGICPFHGDCLEGLANGPSIKARWGKSLSELPQDHPAHAIEAWYLAQLAIALQAMMEPNRIILGGGVMGTPGLLGRVQKEADRLASDYFVGKAADVICAPGLGEKSGLLGALALAMSVSA